MQFKKSRKWPSSKLPSRFSSIGRLILMQKDGSYSIMYPIASTQRFLFLLFIHSRWVCWYPPFEDRFFFFTEKWFSRRSTNRLMFVAVCILEPGEEEWEGKTYRERLFVKSGLNPIHQPDPCRHGCRRLSITRLHLSIFDRAHTGDSPGIYAFFTPQALRKHQITVIPLSICVA